MTRTTWSLLVLCLLALSPHPAASQDEGPIRGRGRGRSMWDRMKRFDANGDGKVTREEFAGPARIFDRADADGDGAVTREEMESMGGDRRRAREDRPARDSRSGSSDSTWIFRRLDRNSDGSFDAKDMEKILELADTDRDGKLGEKEFAEFLSDKADRVRTNQPPEVGKPAPGLELSGIDGGGEVSLASFRGKRPVVLAFGSYT